MDVVVSLSERLTRLEVEVQHLIEAQETTRGALTKIENKLDDLMALRDKGKGAFWLATSLAAAGGVSLLFQFLEWIGLRGAH